MGGGETAFAAAAGRRPRAAPGRRRSTTACGWVLAGLLAPVRAVWGSGLTCSLLASFIFSCSALLVKLTGGRVPVLEVTLARASLAFALSLALLYAARLPPGAFFGQRCNLWLLFVRGACGACSLTSYYAMLFLLPLGDAVTLNLVGPPVTALLARLLLREPLGRRGLLGCVVALAGVALLAEPPFLFDGRAGAWDRARALGTGIGLASAVLGGCSSIAIRAIGGSEPAIVIALWFHTGTMLLSAVLLFAGWPDRAVLISAGDAGLLLGVAAATFAGQLLSTRGLQKCMAAQAAAMGFTQVVYSRALGIAIFGERLTLLGAGGTVLILAGVLMVTLRRRRPAEPPGLAALSMTAAERILSGLPSRLPSALPGRLPSRLPSHVVSRLASKRHHGEHEAAAPLLDHGAELPEDEEAAEPQEEEAAEVSCLLELALSLAADAAIALGGELSPAGDAALAQLAGEDTLRQAACTMRRAFTLDVEASRQSSMRLALPSFLQRGRGRRSAHRSVTGAAAWDARDLQPQPGESPFRRAVLGSFCRPCVGGIVEAQESGPQQGEAQPQEAQPRQGQPQQGQPQQGQPQEAQPQEAQPQQGEPHHGELQQAQPQEGELQQGEPQQGEPQQGEPQQGEPRQKAGQAQPGNSEAAGASSGSGDNDPPVDASASHEAHPGGAAGG